MKKYKTTAMDNAIIAQIAVNAERDFVPTSETVNEIDLSPRNVNFREILLKNSSLALA
jgi:hypothetical protein